MSITIPPECWRTCQTCGGDVVPNPDRIQFDEEEGNALIELHCQGQCNTLISLFRWDLPAGEFEERFGHPRGYYRVPFPDGAEVPPIHFPDELWSRCNKRIRRGVREKLDDWLRRQKALTRYVCDGLKQPDLEWFRPTGYNYWVGCRSTCSECGDVTWIDWEVTPEEYERLFGFPIQQYEYKPDPDDDGDFMPTLSVWTTAKGRRDEYPIRDLDHLVEWLSDYEVVPGWFTVRHWETGAEFDALDFLAQNQIELSTDDDYTDVDEYDDETDEA